MYKILLVCLGNICRSPTAEGVLAKKITQQGLGRRFQVDSAGTAAYHTGESPDRRSCRAAARRGYDLTPLRARQVMPSDFEEFDVILAMDHANLSSLKQNCPAQLQHKLGLFLHYHPDSIEEVPDPYYDGESGFELVLDLVEVAADALIKDLVK
ncbi:low molecular weight phosphotyrosine protein phosphatase [Pokkaliibacter sp. MBI-7]|uniref:low molecular weight protein-tyrosine-phosphatase n=1 Tax=Pokkaliibacter sp. MBI-7 TaxID=3040600 RepID=UPI00244BC170|nr:low molecular weight phosphotyrosine protein phosphatase [Pokkaliibacter sp. MBI-7]MDH2434945.1 low molecular weight phosphotyrosine protein phosphatase [Pokkaliibacter sp. MBI-7]